MSCPRQPNSLHTRAAPRLAYTAAEELQTYVVSISCYHYLTRIATDSFHAGFYIQREEYHCDMQVIVLVDNPTIETQSNKRKRTTKSTSDYHNSLVFVLSAGAPSSTHKRKDCTYAERLRTYGRATSFLFSLFQERHSQTNSLQRPALHKGVSLYANAGSWGQ